MLFDTQLYQGRLSHFMTIATCEGESCHIKRRLKSVFGKHGWNGNTGFGGIGVKNKNPE